MNWQAPGAIGELVGAVAVFVKLLGLDALNDEERTRFGAMIMSSFRRIEAVYIHQSLGAIEPRFAEGFKRSSLSVLAHAGISKVYTWESEGSEQKDNKARNRTATPSVRLALCGPGSEVTR